MLKLYGFSSSNYYNMVKHAMRYKGIAFEEVSAYPGTAGNFLAISPIGKVPALETEHGPLSEVTAILDYLDEVYPENPIYPSDSYAKAKVKQLMKMSELYLELAARRLLLETFAQKQPPADKKKEVKEVLDKGVKAMNDLAHFSPYAAGETFTAADIYLRKVMVVTQMVAKAMFEWDIAADIDGMTEWMRLIDSDEICQQIDADLKEDLPTFMAHVMGKAKA